MQLAAPAQLAGSPVDAAVDLRNARALLVQGAASLAALRMLALPRWAALPRTGKELFAACKALERIELLPPQDEVGVRPVHGAHFVYLL